MTDPRHAYDWHEGLGAPARPRAQLWRLAVGLVVVAIVALLLNGLFTMVLLGLTSPGWVMGLTVGDTPAQLLTLLASFALTAIAVAVALRLMHQRSLGSLIGPRALASRQFWALFWRLGALFAGMALLPTGGFDAPLQPNLALGMWLMLLPLSLGALLIQIGTEEILFRGYLQQTLAARFNSPLIWIGVPSVLFGLGHYDPGTAGGNAAMIAIWAMIFGLVAADLTARAGTLGPALALHLFNNMVAMLFVGMPGTLSGLALYVLPFDMTQTDLVRDWLWVDLASLGVCWLLGRLALRR